jgi:hypothetical protein
VSKARLRVALSARHGSKTDAFDAADVLFGLFINRVRRSAYGIHGVALSHETSPFGLDAPVRFGLDVVTD